MITRSKAEIHKPKVYSASISEEKEPVSIQEALEKINWKAAMQSEYDALLRNQTWTLVPLPPGKNIVGSKWVFKIKRHADESISRYKARMVAQGYTQAARFDFSETFSPVVKPTTIRVILTIVVHYSWKIKQLDVDSAFLNGTLQKKIYMRQPTSFEQCSGTELVCKLSKALMV